MAEIEAENLTQIADEAVEILKEQFKTFADDFANFDENHEAKREKLFNGIRKPKRRAKK